MALNETSTNQGLGTSTQVVVGLFSNGNDAERAIRELKQADFRSSQIGAAFMGSSSSSGYSSGTGFGGSTDTAYDTTTSGTSRAAEGVREAGHSVAQHAESWWERLKHAFSDDDTDTSSDRTSYQTTDLPEAQRRSGEEPFASRITPDTSSSSYGTSSTGTSSADYSAGQPTQLNQENELSGYNEYEYEYSDSDFGGSLASLGVPSDRARALARELGNGGAIVTVRDSSRSAEAERILENAGGRIRHEEGTYAPSGSNFGNAGDYGTNANAPADLAATGTVASEARGYNVSGAIEPEARGYNLSGAVEPDARGYSLSGAEAPEYRSTGTPTKADSDLANSPEANQRIQLFGEVLRVHKNRINRGEVRLRKEIITETQTVQVPVTREEIVIERTPVRGEQPATGASFNQNQEIRVPLTEEVASVEKVPYVREEVSVGKRQVTEERSLDDTVRREELRVEDQTKSPESTRGDVTRNKDVA